MNSVELPVDVTVAVTVYSLVGTVMQGEQTQENVSGQVRLMLAQPAATTDRD